MFDSEVWSVGNCGEIDKCFGGFLKKFLRVKQSTNTSMIYAETGRFAYYNEVRRKYIKLYYHGRSSMYKFQKLMNKSNKRDTFGLMIFMQIVMKYFDLTT